MAMRIDPTPFKGGEDPLPLYREDQSAADFPIHTLGELRSVVEATAEIIQAPIAMVAQSALAVASLAAQTNVDVELLHGSTSPTSLFFLTIAESGERKTSCDKLLTAGIHKHEVEKERAYRSDMERYEYESSEYNKLKKKAKSFESYPAKPVEPIHPMRLVGDPTYEGLVKAFIKGHPSVLILSDEAGVILGGYTFNKDNRIKTAAGLSKVWDGSPINRTRGGDGTQTLRGRRSALHLMVQPIVVEPLLSDPITNGQGFLSRTLISKPNSLIGTRTFKQASQEAYKTVNEFNTKVKKRIEWKPRKLVQDRQVLEPRILTLDPLCHELARGYYDKIEILQNPGMKYAFVKAAASKSLEMAIRIAGVLSYWSKPSAKSLDLVSVESGIELAEYYLDEALRLTNVAQVSNETQNAQILLEWLHKNWEHKTVMPSEIVQKGPSRLRELNVVKETLTILRKAEHLIALEPGTTIRGKPRKEAYSIIGK